MIKKKAPTKKSPPKKKSTVSTTKKPDKVEPPVTILQTAKCQSMSGKSTLTYNIGVDEEDAAFIRINANSGGGYWSKEWVSIEEIKAKISNATDEKPIASFQLQPLFNGKSVNTPSFLLALLLKEGLLRTVPKMKRVSLPKTLSRPCGNGTSASSTVERPCGATVPWYLA